MPRSFLIALLLSCLAQRALADEALFRQRVAPILEQHCVGCHQGAEPKGGLSLVEAKSASSGGDSGPPISPGRPDDSLIVGHISGDKPEMPKDAPPLPAADIAAIRRWIAEGAAWPADLKLVDRRKVDEHWWSLEPLAACEVPRAPSPWVRTPVDAFIQAKLESQALSPSPEADPRTLVRRLSYDLLGLPPAPEEVEAFAQNPSDEAYLALVDRMLASPRYGERWGRYWLDIVHFGESHGYDKDKPRGNAWPYRDYVIASFNQDKPYDRFVAEQIAGDVLDPSDPGATVATGFIVAGPWDFVGHVELREGTVDKDIARSNDRDDMVANAMSTFLSLTVHCARCHDHKFDPIRQQDYYALQAVFAGVERADRPYEVDMAVAQSRRDLLAEKGRLEAELARLRPPAAADKSATGAQATAPAPTAEIAAAERRLREVETGLAALPPAGVVFAAASQFAPQGSFTPPAAPRAIHLLARGDVRSPRQVVVPAGVACVRGPDATFALAEGDGESRRRLELARWLTDPRNALLRRSIVNRVWQYHFGQGIVDTPNDFGRMGSTPTHPELLEWLAGWFMENGHSLKRLHRLLVTSAVYRQASRHDPARAQIDGGNRYLWRANRQRLDAEAVRDAMLAVSGRLDRTMGGPSMQQFFFKDDHSPIYDYARFDPDDPRGRRRSIYRFLVRSVPDPFMECLDCADPSIMTPKRNTTLTAIQALALLNNPLAVRQAEHFAQRLTSLAADTPARIEWAYRLALARSPSERERAAMCEYVERHSLAGSCRLLFNSNEFVFVD